MRPPSQMKWRSDPNFSTFRIGSRELVIHRDIASQAAQIMQKLGELTSAVEAGAGNRQSAYGLDLDGGQPLGRSAFFQLDGTSVGTGPGRKLVAYALANVVDRPDDANAVERVRVGQLTGDPDGRRERTRPADGAPFRARIDRKRSWRQHERLPPWSLPRIRP